MENTGHQNYRAYYIHMIIRNSFPLLNSPPPPPPNKELSCKMDRVFFCFCFFEGVGGGGGEVRRGGGKVGGGGSHVLSHNFVKAVRVHCKGEKPQS